MAAAAARSRPRARALCTPRARPSKPLLRRSSNTFHHLHRRLPRNLRRPRFSSSFHRLRNSSREVLPRSSSCFSPRRRHRVAQALRPRQLHPRRELPSSLRLRRSSTLLLHLELRSLLRPRSSTLLLHLELRSLLRPRSSIIPLRLEPRNLLRPRSSISLLHLEAHSLPLLLRLAPHRRSLHHRRPGRRYA
jgi:hypothetical protein